MRSVVLVEGESDRVALLTLAGRRGRDLAGDGVEVVAAVIEGAGESHSLELLAGMPVQRGWAREAALRRFLGVRSGRKARYAALLVEALPSDRVPEPLESLLRFLSRG